MDLSEKRKKQIDYLGITADDLFLLESKKAELTAIADALVEELYNRIMLRPELRTIIEAHSTIERLKKNAEMVLSFTDRRENR